MGVHRKIWFLGGGFTKKQYIWGIAKKGGGGAWTVCRFKEWGVLVKKKGVVIPQCTLCYLYCSLRSMPRCCLGNQMFIFTNFLLFASFPKTFFLGYNLANAVIPPSFLTNILLCFRTINLCCSEKAVFQNYPDFSWKFICMFGPWNL